MQQLNVTINRLLFFMRSHLDTEYMCKFVKKIKKINFKKYKFHYAVCVYVFAQIFKFQHI